MSELQYPILANSQQQSSDAKLEVSYGPPVPQQQIQQYVPQVVYIQPIQQPAAPQQLPVPGRTQVGWSPDNADMACNCSKNCGFCMLATVFPCCAYGRNRGLARHGDVHGEDQHGCVCNSDCWKFFGVCALTNAVAHGGGAVTTSFMGARSRAKLKAYIGEPSADQCCSNYCAWFWCSPCAMTQEREELKKLLTHHQPRPVVPQPAPQRTNSLQPPPIQDMLSGQNDPRIY